MLFILILTPLLCSVKVGQAALTSDDDALVGVVIFWDCVDNYYSFWYTEDDM